MNKQRKSNILNFSSLESISCCTLTHKECIHVFFSNFRDYLPVQLFHDLSNI